MRTNNIKTILIILIILFAINVTINTNKTDAFTINNKVEKTDEISNTGKLYGYTATSYCWSFNPVKFAYVEAIGIKSTISGYIGKYELSNLPLDQDIIVTASKKGYKSDSIKIKLTNEKPTYYYCFDLQEKENYIKNIDVKFLFSTVFIGSNTWSDFFSTFSLVS